jgi:23S rRNA (uracil1939-C5)-methyltransferase
MANFFKAVAKPQLSNLRLSVNIDKLDMNGVGVGRWQNKPIFIPGALPNETVEVKVIEQRSKYSRAKLLTIKKQNVNRVEPLCQHFGLCGGCDLQMLDVIEQLVFKQNKVSDLFSRSFSELSATKNINIDELPWLSPITSNPWHYRRKARIGVQFDKNAQATIGFRQKSTNQLASIKACPVLVEPLDSIFPKLKKVLAALTIKSAIGHIEVIYADLVTQKSLQQKSSQVVVVIRQLKPMNNQDIDLWKLYAQKHCWHIVIDDGLKQYLLAETKNGSETTLSYSLADSSRISFTSSDFIQINHKVNCDMINQALTWLNISPSDNVLDLFCGLGNFSLALAKKSHHVVGVEGVQAMVNKASNNATENSIDNCQFYQADLNSHWLSEPWAQEQVFDKVLLDPARAGAEQAVIQIAKLKVSMVLYVSCDPATLARDSAILVSQGYTLNKMSIMDMFSQTKHVEIMVLFTR